MFSRQSTGSPYGAAVRRRNRRERIEHFETPLDELVHRTERLHDIVRNSRDSYASALLQSENGTVARREGIMSKVFRNRASAVEKSPSSADSVASLDDETPKIVPMEDGNEAVECLRRIAELVVYGERVGAREFEIREKLMNQGDTMTEEQKSELRHSQSPDSEQYLALFDEFFERKGLELIVNIATGRCFQSSVIVAADDRSEEFGSTADTTPSDVNASFGSHDTAVSDIHITLDRCILLPPIVVATQAVQSVSILVQNVSRATSLYFILSNNRINEMIDMPLDKYKQADWKTRSVAQTVTQRKHASPEISELSTHFITFLKSLAMRMNVETLQFFLTFPMEQVNDEESDTQTASSSFFSVDEAFDAESPFNGGTQQQSEQDDNNNNYDDYDDRPSDEIIEDRDSSKRHAAVEAEVKPVVLQEVEVRFPLYARALEFCAAHQDSFIRTTAMNICLNTLRLATVQPPPNTDPNDINFSSTASSPDGVLHNAKPLPFRERLSIAQHVCSPARVERLVSPIFTKLAQLWGILEEKFREAGEKDVGSQSTAKIAVAKETSRRKRMMAAFKDIAYKLQDELELLEDVLKVGLTSLNEQVIEMMLATFIYPLLLQPLLLYFQRSQLPDSVMYADPLHDHTTGRPIKPVDYADAEKSFISAPAKSAFFMLTLVFYSVTNRPLLNLLFCALLHPLAPDSSGETMIRAKADVACVDANGKKSIRVDPSATHSAPGTRKSSVRQPAYLFGTVTGEKFHSSKAKSVHNVGMCTFVLAPALAEVLDSTGDDLAIIARSRQNPYRRALFKCCTLSHELSDLKPLSIMVLDAAVSALDEKSVVDILQGVKFKKRFGDSTPLDERRSDSTWARSLDDRGIGGPAANESRLSLNGDGKFSYDFLNEILTSFRSSLICATPGCNGNWKLVFDPVAAHAFLCATRGSADVLATASKGSLVRCRQAAGFLSDMPQAIEKFLGSAWVFSKDPKLRSGMITDVLFYSKSTSNSDAVVDNLTPVRDPDSTDSDGTFYAVPICRQGSCDELCTRACSFPPSQYSTNDASIEEAMSSTNAWLQVDAFCNFIQALVDNQSLHSSDQKLQGFTLTKAGRVVSVGDYKTLYGRISSQIQHLLFSVNLSSTSGTMSSGTVVSLVGQIAIPCVCEAPPSSAHLFSADSAKTMEEGVTWQSLYLVILDGFFILAEPHRRPSRDGRVVTACPLDTMDVQRDETEAAESTVARRLLLTQRSYTKKAPPGLFLLEKDAKKPAVKNAPLVSVLDVWFENQKASDKAFGIMNDSILRAKANRGMYLRHFLAEFRS